MSDIPKARKLIQAALDEGVHDLFTHATLTEALSLMQWNVTKKRSPRTLRSLTPEEAAEIRAIVKRNPETPLMELASRYGVNPGRVSEAAKGKR